MNLLRPFYDGIAVWNRVHLLFHRIHWYWTCTDQSSCQLDKLIENLCLQSISLITPFKASVDRVDICSYSALIEQNCCKYHKCDVWLLVRTCGILQLFKCTCTVLIATIWRMAEDWKGGQEFECTMRDYHGNHTNTWPKWMIPDTLVQFFIAVQIKIFSESSVAILKSKMAQNGHF